MKQLLKISLPWCLGGKFFPSIFFTFCLIGNAFSQAKEMTLAHEKCELVLKEIIAKSHGKMGLCAFDLTSGERFSINENLLSPQASAIKTTILMEVYKQAHEGKFKLSDSRRVQKENKTGGSGILAELGDGTVEMSIHDLCVLMILMSDNTATNMLLDLVGKENINKTLASLGFKETKVQRRMMDTAAAQRGEENLSTPAEAGRIMEILFKGEFLNSTICDDILSILKKSKTSNLQSGLPSGVEIASKPGNLPTVATEWAIVFLKNRPYILVVMENHSTGQAPELMKDISRTIYNYFASINSKKTPVDASLDK